jgi:hypothetical protein
MRLVTSKSLAIPVLVMVELRLPKTRGSIVELGAYSRNQRIVYRRYAQFALTDGRLKMHIYKSLGLLILSCLLTGCGAIEKLEQKSAFSVGAVPLVFTDESNVPTDWPNVNNEWAQYRKQMYDDLGIRLDKKKDYLGFVVSASEHRCATFLTSLVVSSNGTHTALDMITTVFSVLGTAFTPIATVHALTAGATISNGWKNAIDTDIYAQLALQDMLQEILDTYYNQMNIYK